MKKKTFKFNKINVDEKLNAFYDKHIVDMKFFNDAEGGTYIALPEEKSKLDCVLERRKKYVQKMICIEKGCNKHVSTDNR